MQILDFNNSDLYVDWVQEVARPLYDESIRYILLKGGAGAGKSHVVAQLLLQNVLDGRRVGVVRKLYSTIKASCFQLLSDYRKRRKLELYIEERQSFGELQTVKGLCKMFGMDDEEKIKSLADYDWFWVEEANELTYDDFVQLDLRLRGGRNHKIICTFNPVSAQSRLKTRIKDSPGYDHNSVWIEKTARDNKFVDEQYLKTLESLREKNPSKYKIYALNEWGEGLKGLIYPSYEVFDYDIEPDIIGLDFGFNHPTALVYLKFVDEGKKEKLYIQEKIYLRELTGPSLIQLMQDIGVPKNVTIVADCARPELIREIKKAGYTIVESPKGSGSVKDGINMVKSFDLYLNGTNLVSEANKYVWRLDKNGDAMDEPVKQDDDIFDATRYGVYYHRGGKKVSLFLY